MEKSSLGGTKTKNIFYPGDEKEVLRQGELSVFKLENGLEVILFMQSSISIVAVDIWYKVGSRDEQPGKSGFAHLFEHMMFEGSKNVGKAQHMKLINDVGGMVNGSTSQDRTNYWEVIPSNQLELALWLEADRMRSLDLSQKNFDNQRATVKEERRQRIDNQPYMRVLYELKDELAYINFPYKHSIIGSMTDLDNASLDDVRNFHEIYYKPNNAVLTIAGDIELNRTMDLIKKYFSDIKPGVKIPSVDLYEPLQSEEKKEIYLDPFAPFPAVVSAYHIPGRNHPDFYALEMLEKVILNGESSRLYRSMVEENQLALHVLGGNDGKVGPALFFIFAQAHPAHTVNELLSAINFEMEQLAENGISTTEFDKAKNKIKSEWISRRESVRIVADYLCMYATVFERPELFYNELKRFDTLTPTKLQNVAKRYFKPTNRLTIEVHPKRKV
jgi:zinc protease